jgi:hypothetical protein
VNNEGRVSRRTVLRLGLGGAVVAIGAVVTRNVLRDDEHWLASELEKMFPYLDFAPGTTRDFTSEYLAAYKRPARALLPVIGDQFLRSTDFFLHDADESRQIAYATLWDPFVHPCYNPLATSLR